MLVFYEYTIVDFPTCIDIFLYVHLDAGPWSSAGCGEGSGSTPTLGLQRSGLVHPALCFRYPGGGDWVVLHISVLCMM